MVKHLTDIGEKLNLFHDRIVKMAEKYGSMEHPEVMKLREKYSELKRKYVEGVLT